MKIALLFLSCLCATLSARAEIILANRYSAPALMRLQVNQAGTIYPVAVMVPASATVVLHTPKASGSVVSVVASWTEGTSSQDFSAAPMDIAGEVNVILQASGGVSAYYVPVGFGQDVANLWPWWFKGFGLGIGFCTLGAFVRMIRSARGATSLEL